jgi:hypothetical protein
MNTFIIASNSSLDYFNNSYLGNYTKKGICRIVETTSYHYFRCSKESFNISELEDVNIVIDGYGYKAYVKDLFVTLPSNDSIFLIYFGKQHSDWIIGQPLLKNYLVVFDGEMDLVGFYGGPVVNLNTTSWWWIFGIIIVIVMMVGIVLTVLYFCRRKPEDADYGRQH